MYCNNKIFGGVFLLLFFSMIIFSKYLLTLFLPFSIPCLGTFVNLYQQTLFALQIYAKRFDTCSGLG